MNPTTYKEAKKLFEATKKAAEKAPHVTVVVAPPAIFLHDLKSSYRGKRLSFAVQNARSEFEAGDAFTGETSLSQCKDAGASHVIIGHAERRAMGETDEETGVKVAAALAIKMTPILCVGEKERRGDSGEQFEVVRAQLRAGFSAVESAQVGRIIVAYEPVWAIGKAAAMEPRDMHEMAIFIRKTLVDLKGAAGMNIKILYGGSIDADNAALMLQNGDVVGLLVGRASVDAEKLSALLQSIEMV